MWQLKKEREGLEHQPQDDDDDVQSENEVNEVHLLLYLFAVQPEEHSAGGEPSELYRHLYEPVSEPHQPHVCRDGLVVQAEYDLPPQPDDRVQLSP